MLLNLKKLKRILYCSKNEFLTKILKSFLLKNNLNYSIRLITIYNFEKLIYHIGQINNFCNLNKKYRSVYRFLRLNKLNLNLIIKCGFFKNIKKASW